MTGSGLFLTLFFVVVFTSASAISFALTPVEIWFCRKIGMMDVPGGRKTHREPMPVLGGCVLFVSFWTSVLAAFLAAHVHPTHDHRILALINGSRSLLPTLMSIFTGSLIILLLGIIDDKFDINPFWKFIGQIAAVSMLIGSGLTINLVSSLGILGPVVTFVWLLLIINAFNFIDSVDGHCAGIALISSVFFLCIAQIINQPLVVIFIVTFAGALFGFLPYNFKLARTFLGDNGSLFIGYMLGAVTLLCNYQIEQGNRVTQFIPIFMFGVPIYDTLSVVAVRIIRGIPPWRGDKNHFAHRLIRLGMSDQIAVVFSYSIAATLGLVALLSTQIHTLLGAGILALLFACIIAIIAFLEYYSMLRIHLAEAMHGQNRRRREDIRDAESRRFDQK